MKFFQKHQKKLVAILALVLALLMLLPAISMIVTTAGAVTQAEIDRLKDQAANLANDKKNLNKQLAALEGEINSAYSKKRVVEQEINVVNEQINNTTQMISMYDQLIAQEEENLAAAQENETVHYDEFCRRVRAMEEEGNVTYWHILFNAADFTDLLDKAMMVSEIVEYDNAVMKALEQARIQVENAKAELESARAAQVDAKAALAAQKAELDAKENDIEALLSEMQAKQDVYESKIHELDSQMEAMDKKIAQKEEEYKRLLAQSQINTGSSYIWPVEGNYTITSFFGPRKHPITGKAGNHGGTDVRAAYGVPIKSAQGGIVTASEYHWSYGNYVSVLHPDGNSTLYAHMSKRAVSEGQVVSQGQVLGYVGSTGSSTGNHLHYEIRVNKVRVDALNYYKGMTFWTTDGTAFKP